MSRMATTCITDFTLHTPEYVVVKNHAAGTVLSFEFVINNRNCLGPGAGLPHFLLSLSLHLFLNQDHYFFLFLSSMSAYDCIGVMLVPIINNDAMAVVNMIFLVLFIVGI